MSAGLCMVALSFANVAARREAVRIAGLRSVRFEPHYVLWGRVANPRQSFTLSLRCKYVGSGAP